VRREFGTEDFVSRRYAPGGGPGELDLFAARSFDGKRLYHYPETALVRSGNLSGSRLVEIEVRGARIPVRALEFTDRDQRRLARYALFYGRRPVAEPVHFHFSLLPELLVGRREPMTLIFVQATLPLEGGDARRRRLEGLLAAACDAYLR
jgi:hypothetical protein